MYVSVCLCVSVSVSVSVSFFLFFLFFSFRFFLFFVYKMEEGLPQPNEGTLEAERHQPANQPSARQAQEPAMPSTNKEASMLCCEW